MQKLAKKKQGKRAAQRIFMKNLEEAVVQLVKDVKEEAEKESSASPKSSALLKKYQR